MKSTELRIGNLVYGINRRNEVHLPNETPLKIWQIEIFNCEVLPPDKNPAEVESYLKISNVDITGIPLTEDWLLKFGLKASSTKGIASFAEEVEEGDTYWWEEKVKRSELTDGFNFCIVRWGDKGEFTFSYQDLRVRIKYVHQLQNIYYSLTGIDLIIQSLSVGKKKKTDD